MEKEARIGVPWQSLDSLSWEVYKRIQLQLFLISVAVVDLALNALILNCSLSGTEINMAYVLPILVALPHTHPTAQASPHNVI